ncbi:hypothetical protein DEU56DRAFT_787211 [Suillus clintonianus]|uniref:uncharacterized protein n=1 Tax=Suillus clintonianus TaxID=1904413 RepID=UPI001B877340|nr:uncharacterized protein DEU56DRAFT_787211 [Suillus clintonianus]KAG2146263.1 hypothetical protein DEU56DRAFT_787211 [Suillus clintonianus]
MTPRPLISSSSRRPLSAIFLGSLPPKGQIIPDLPEPPESPSAASSSSGLPSPPATNSTGSGSTGDNKSATAGSLRQRPPSYASSATMSDRNYDTPSTPAKSSRNIDDDDDDENDYSNEEDDTARLDRSHAVKSPNENLVALQRVKSLAERNRMALNKLSSFSRLSTPSPANSRASRSPLPPIHASSSSSSSSAASRISSHSHSHSAPMTRQYDSALSGSETERESQRAPTPSYSNSHSNSRSYGSSSPERSSTPPPSSSTRERRISAPASPVRSRQSSPAPSHPPRKRISITGAPRDDSSYDVTSAALAAVASSRRSPTGTGSVNRRSRQPLPREFRDGDRDRNTRTLDGRTSIEPMTPHHNSHQDSYTSNANTSLRTSSYTNANSQHSPRGARANRSSTVRELTRRHQTRWLSEDISNLPDSGRRQTQRGGSAESTLGAGGRLVGEGLRAAGIGMRNGTQANDDVFAHNNDSHASLRRARTAGSSTRTVEWEDEDRASDDRSRASGSSGARRSEGPGPSTRPHLSSDPSRASSALLVERDSRGGRTASSRPATSMAGFYHGEDGSAGRGTAFSLRSRRQHSDIEQQPPGASPGIRPLPLQQTPAAPTPPDRSRTGTLTRRHTTMTPLGNGSVSSLHSHQQSAEHTKLMLESLTMFENILSRLPNQSSVPDLFRSAETIVLASEKLNALLRTGTNRALEQQIDAEMDDEIPGEIPTGEIWRRVGGEYREGLRVSDEVVRTITGFLLGVGKIVKEASAGALNDPGQQHSRSGLDDDVSRQTPEIDRSSNRSRLDGRRSVESRRSWEPSAPSADLSRRLTGRGEGAVARPPSSRDRISDQDQPSSSRNVLPPLPLSATRRLFTPREQREYQMTSNALASHNTPSDAVDLSLEYEPSPTPASRSVPAGRQKPLPALAIPPPLPTLPSESLMRRSTSSLLEKSNRRKPSATSTATIRGPTAPFPLPSANPTTAVTTHTVSNSPENSTFPLSRVDSQDSVRSSVTFSRPSEVSLSALQQHHIRDEARRKVVSSSNAEEDTIVPPPPSPAQIRSPLSGSETERDTRRRTFGVRAARMSLDSIRDEREGDNGGSQSRTVALPTQRRERRRTVTEVFAQRS